MKIIMLSLMISTSAMAVETVPEKMQAVSNDVIRSIKKAINRVTEMFCFEGDLKCAAKKLKNRAEEAKDLAVDTAVELKNKVN